MNISTRRTALFVIITMATTGVFDLHNGSKLLKASIGIFDNPAIKWGAIIGGAASIIAGTVYLLANKNALKRRIVEFGEVGYVVINGKPKRYRRGKHAGTLAIRTEGQGKNVIPKLRDVVIASWLIEIIEVVGMETVFRGRRIGFDLTIEYSLPELRDRHDEATKELLHDMVFGFRDGNRYNEELGALERHIIQRCKAKAYLPFRNVESTDVEGLPIIDTDAIDWLKVVKFHDIVKLASLRVIPTNLHYLGQVELYNR